MKSATKGKKSGKKEVKMGILEKEADNFVKWYQSLMIRLWLLWFIGLVVIYYMVGAGDAPFKLFTDIVLISICLLLLTTGILLHRTIKIKEPYSNLTVHSEVITREAAGKTIDEEDAAGKTLLNEYVVEGATGGNVVLLPSYLLICQFSVTAVPVEDIYWICAQVGKKNSKFVVRLTVFGKYRMYHSNGVDPARVQRIVNRIYEHLPNVFAEYDQDDLCYKLEKVYVEDRERFLEFYNQHKEPLEHSSSADVDAKE